MTTKTPQYVVLGMHLLDQRLLAESKTLLTETQITTEDFPKSDHDIDNVKERLRELWGHVLHEDPSSFDDHDVFFEVGGDSISAQGLMIAARTQGILLSVEQIFTYPSLDEMAHESCDIRPDDDTDDVSILEPFSSVGVHDSLKDQIAAIATSCDITPGKVQNAYPCSRMQEFLVTEFDGSKNSYVLQLVYELSADVPLERFRKAWRDTVNANPVLRTRICRSKESARYIQAVIDEDLKWNTIDDSLDQYLSTDTNLSMQLGDPFFRYAIIFDSKYGGQIERYFVWTLHHALCDGVSILEILDEVSRRFQGEPTPQREPFERFIRSHLDMTDTW